MGVRREETGEGVRSQTGDKRQEMGVRRQDTDEGVMTRETGDGRQ